MSCDQQDASRDSPCHSVVQLDMATVLKILFFVFLFLLTLNSHVQASRDSLIQEYFRQGYPYQLILCFLYFIHGISLSLRQLKRILRRLGLRRRPPAMNRRRERQLEAAIRAELQGSSSVLGYRFLWRRICLSSNIPFTRDSVMRALARIDPRGSRERRRNKLTRRQYTSKGPNYVWHCDGMDKLKRFGIAIHGCIDGYSRKVLWLKAGTTNNNPRIVAYYFMEYVTKFGGVPRLLRTDCGTENTNLAFIQPYLRRSHTDCFSGIESFRYGRSVSNQRIEAWWSQLKRLCTVWWHQLFMAMHEGGLYDETNFVHVDCFALCFMDLVQKDLDKIKAEWNCHRIRECRQSCCPSGHPNELYELPQLLGSKDYSHTVDPRDLRVVKTYTEEPDPPACLEFLELALPIMTQHHLSMPNTVQEALNLYVTLTTIIQTEINSR